MTDTHTPAASSTLSSEVQQFVASQPRYAWRRRLLRGLVRLVLFRLVCKVTVTGTENIPDEGPAILMMNHISLLDPILCLGAVTNRFVVPMSKVENDRNPLLGPLVRFWGSYSVNRGEVDRKALTNSIELARSGTLILIAPEGTRQPQGLSQPKDGLAYVATKANAVVIPATIMGAVGWQEKLKRLQRPRIQVNFGRPFRFRTDGRARIPREELSAMTEEAMYQLAIAVTDETMRGVYSDLSKATTNHIEFINP
jgi:1-acyl-sn-glycerol-3-phosphate acyltransferase